MTSEIERKFLIFERGENHSTEAMTPLFPSIFSLKDAVLTKGTKIRQGYLPIEIGEELRRVTGLEKLAEVSEARLRDYGGRYFLTLKTNGGLIRGETPDTEISRTIFELYWPYAKRRIEKVRLQIPYSGQIAEFDVYSDRDLIVAEVETDTEAEAQAVVPLGFDVTFDSRYKNSSLAREDFHRKFILTGGPSSGKSKTIDYLASMRYPIVPESARRIIDEQLKNGGKIVPWERFLEFQLEVLHSSLSAEQSLLGEGTVFLDRGIPDALGYCVSAGIDPPTPLIDAMKNKDYKAVFVLDPLPYRNDIVRRESPEEALRIHISLLDLYEKFGYDPIRVPVNLEINEEESVRERAHFVVNKSHNTF